MRKKSIDVVAENIIKERGGKGGTEYTTDGYTIVGNRYRFFRTCNDIATESKYYPPFTHNMAMNLLENAINNANEFIQLPTLKEITEKVNKVKANPEYKRGSRIVCNVGGVTVNVKYLIDAIKAVKEDGLEIRANTWTTQGKYRNPLLVTTETYRTICFILPIMPSKVEPVPVGAYAFDGKFNTKVFVR